MKLKGIAAVMLAIILALAFALSGCGEMSPKDVVKKAIEANSSIKSMESDFVMDYVLEAGGQEASIGMTGSAVFHDAPLRLKMGMDMSIPGLDAPVKSEIYGLEEGDGFATYTYAAAMPGMDSGAGSWLKQTLPTGDLGQLKQANTKASLEFYLTSADNFVLEGEETINGAACSKLSGVLQGDAMKKAIMDSSAMAQAGINAAMLDGLGDLPLVIWVDSKSFIPLKYSMDMTALMDGLMSKLASESGANAVSVKSCAIEMTFKNINAAPEVELPPEAANATELPAM